MLRNKSRIESGFLTVTKKSSMSLKSRLIRTAIRLTPNLLIVWAANWVLKGIAELAEFKFDLDARTVYVKTRLYGEEGSLELSLEDFAVFHDGESYRFIIHHARSDRPWLHNLLAKFIGKAWKIPAIPQLSAQLALIAEVFQNNTPALESTD